jgi:hypothetical protein
LFPTESYSGNSVIFAETLSKNKVKNDIYLYDKGGHGYGMTNPTSDVLWMGKVSHWLETMHFK